MKLTTLTLLAVATTITSPIAETTPRASRATGHSPSTCADVALAAHEAERTIARGALQLSLAQAVHASDPVARERLEHAAVRSFEDDLERIEARRVARLALCERTGGSIAAPVIDPTRFSDVIESPFMSLPAGRVLRYVRTGGEVTQLVTVSATTETVTIMGVSCRVVRDVVRAGGDIEEITEEYFATDVDGNVWIFGERTIGDRAGDGIHSQGGSWRAGVRGAQPGIVVPGRPIVGRTLRGGFLLGVVEEAATTVALGTEAEVEFGRFEGCLEIVTQSPLDPTEIELKTLAPGLGLVGESNLESGERLELVEVVR